MTEPQANPPATEQTEEAVPQWELQLETYPLRSADQDPKWAIRTVVGWTIFVIFAIAGMTLLTTLAYFYD